MLSGMAREVVYTDRSADKNCGTCAGGHCKGREWATRCSHLATEQCVDANAEELQSPRPHHVCAGPLSHVPKRSRAAGAVWQDAAAGSPAETSQSTWTQGSYLLPGVPQLLFIPPEPCVSLNSLHHLLDVPVLQSPADMSLQAFDMRY